MDVWQFSPLGLRVDGRIAATTLLPPSFINHILPFNPPQPALQSLAVIRYDNGAGIVTWLRSGSGPELALPAQLLLSADGSVYTRLGTMHRCSSGWRLAGAVLPLQQTFYRRTQARTTQVQSRGTGNGLVQSAGEYHLTRNEGIFIDGLDGG